MEKKNEKVVENVEVKEEKKADEVAHTPIDLTIKRLVVVRKTYNAKNKEERFTYFIEGSIRGKKIEASIIPTDIKGYDLLDIVFGDDNKALLNLVPYSMTDESTGEIREGFTYEVINVDEDNEVYSCTVKPREKSDKKIIEKFLAQLA